MKSRNLLLIGPWTLFVVAALGWVLYWNYLANEAERRVHAWQFEQNAGGATVEIGEIVRHGFPVLLRLEMRNVRYVAARGGWRAETARADLNIDPLKPQHAILEAKAPISIARANGATTMPGPTIRSRTTASATSARADRPRSAWPSPRSSRLAPSSRRR